MYHASFQRSPALACSSLIFINNWLYITDLFCIPGRMINMQWFIIQCSIYCQYFGSRISYFKNFVTVHKILNSIHFFIICKYIVAPPTCFLNAIILFFISILPFFCYFFSIFLLIFVLNFLIECCHLQVRDGPPASKVKSASYLSLSLSLTSNLLQNIISISQ